MTNHVRDSYKCIFNTCTVYEGIAHHETAYIVHAAGLVFTVVHVMYRILWITKSELNMILTMKQLVTKHMRIPLETHLTDWLGSCHTSLDSCHTSHSMIDYYIQVHLQMHDYLHNVQGYILSYNYTTVKPSGLYLTFTRINITAISAIHLVHKLRHTY